MNKYIASVTLLGVMTTLLVLALFASIGCASTAPYTVSVYDPRDPMDTSRLAWFEDGPDIVLTVRNNTNKNARLAIHCAGADNVWEVNVPSRGEIRGVGRLMNKDVHANPCQVEEIVR